jgi:rhodanese-related sulfurtransferase
MDAYLRQSHPIPIAPSPSTISAATMAKVSRDQLASFLLDPSSTSTSESAKSSPLAGIKPVDLAIVDVRDSDYIGGHIRSCIHVPSANLEWKLPELVRQLWDKEAVVFHCALSQQRGPSAAAKYARERERQERQRWAMQDSTPEDSEKSIEGESSSMQKEKHVQKVLVLAGGFVEWQEKYGEDERITEGYAKDIWAEQFY